MNDNQEPQGGGFFYVSLNAINNASKPAPTPKQPRKDWTKIGAYRPDLGR